MADNVPGYPGYHEEVNSVFILEAVLSDLRTIWFKSWFWAALTSSPLIPLFLICSIS
ncbi:hypothetical protein D3C73_1630600 [compost metagenome]